MSTSARSELPPRNPDVSAQERPNRSRTDPGPERFCPNCGAELIERSCKLLCPNRQCGYAMSCSEFY